MNFMINESATKLRGGYYTDPEVAHFLSRWVLAGAPRRILEPGCGDGAFFAAIAKIPHASVRSIIGVERDVAEAAKAGRQAASIDGAQSDIVEGDYLEWSLKNIMAGEQFDGILGNPPYVRYQYLEEPLQQRAERLFAAYRLPFTRHTNLWVSFVIAALGQLAPGGRLGMVVPAELLHVLHAQPLRDHLLTSCSRILVVDPQELWFEKTLQGVVLLLAERRRPERQQRAEIGIAAVKGREDLLDAEQLFERTRFHAGDAVRGKWMSLMLSDRERASLEAFTTLPTAQPFKRVAEVDVGIVTGANKFFLITDEVVETYQLGRWVSPMFGRSEHVQGVIYSTKTHARNTKLGHPTNFLNLGTAALASFPKKVREYIKTGEDAELHTRYKCRIRKPWYAVPSVWTAPIGMLKRSHDFPRLVLNTAGALTTDTAYRIKPMKGTDPSRLVVSFINSGTMLTAELEGRHYGGGVLELVPSEIERLVIPMVRRAPSVRSLDARFVRGEVFEEILRGNDGQVLSTAGLSTRDQEMLFGAWDRLRKRRQRDPGPGEAVEA